MPCKTLGCQGSYDFEHVAVMAKKRFIEGIDTITLMQEAKTEREKEEIVLIALLNIEDEQIKQIQLACPHQLTCHVVDCRKRLKLLLGPLLKQPCQPPANHSD
ncbi:MAG: hypothetical protein V7629_18230 [Motiliproteus sp.]